MLLVLFCTLAFTSIGNVLADSQLEVEGVRFGNMTTVLITNTWTLLHLEEKLDSPNEFLLSGHNHISISIGLSAQSLTSFTPLAGNRSMGGYGEGVGAHAMFNGITGFCQNKTHVILVDKGNHCIRTVSYSHHRTSTLAGTCERSGYVDGAAARAQFQSPENIIRAQTESSYMFLVTDGANNAIRVYNPGMKKVSTFVKDDKNLLRPTDMILDSEGPNLFVTSSALGLLTVHIHTRVISKVSYQQAVSPAFGHTTKMAAITPCLYVIANRDDNSLSLFDRKADKITQVCSGAKSSINANIQHCAVSGPYSVFWSRNMSAILIGATQRVRKLPVSLGVSQNCTAEAATWPTVVVFASTTPSTRQSSGPAYSHDYKQLTQENNLLRYVAYSSLGLIFLLAVVVIVFMISCRGNGFNHQIYSNYLSQRWRRRTRHPLDSLPHLAPPSFTSTIPLYEDNDMQQHSTGLSRECIDVSDHSSSVYDNQTACSLRPLFSPLDAGAENSEDHPYMSMNRQAYP